MDLKYQRYTNEHVAKNIMFTIDTKVNYEIILCEGAFAMKEKSYYQNIKRQSHCLAIKSFNANKES